MRSFYVNAPPPPRSTLFPYTTLFRSLSSCAPGKMTSHAVVAPQVIERPDAGRAGAHRRAALDRHPDRGRSEEHTSELQSQFHLVCRLLLEKKKQVKKHVCRSKAVYVR